MTSSASSRRGTESDAVTRQAFLPFSSIRLARSGSAPFGSVRRDLRAISVNRVAPFLRSTIPLPDTSSVRKLNLEASATARNVNMKQVSTAASSRCSGLHASPGPSKSFGGAERNGGTASSCVHVPQVFNVAQLDILTLCPLGETCVEWVGIAVDVMSRTPLRTLALPPD
jgi:hypothetical protein